MAKTPAPTNVGAGASKQTNGDINNRFAPISNGPQLAQGNKLACALRIQRYEIRIAPNQLHATTYGQQHTIPQQSYNAQQGQKPAALPRHRKTPDKQQTNYINGK